MDANAEVRASGERGMILLMPSHPVMARFYDRLLASSERAGLAEIRERLIARASGRTLEVGAGTGLNLAHYPAAVSELVLAEPDPHMASRLRAKVAEHPPPVSRVSVIEAPAEELPYDDGSFDTVVSTLVLCTVESPERAVAEVRRLLVEDGVLLFAEHVRGESRRLAWWQDRLERPWGLFAGGCHPNRPTEATIAGGGFWIEQLDQEAFPKAPRLVRPMITGVARRPSPVGRD